VVIPLPSSIPPTDIGPQHLILDLGCGDGRVLVAAALARQCGAGVGVDISEVRISACLERPSAASFHTLIIIHLSPPYSSSRHQPQDCIDLARSIAAAESVDADGRLTFHTLDLLARDSALAFLAAQAQAAITKLGASANKGKEVVVFLYVYPTLLARLDGLVEGLLASLSRSALKVKAVTLTYHFAGGAAPTLVRRSEAGGRFVVYSLA